MAKLEKITDQQVLSTIKLKELIDPVKGKFTPTEWDDLKNTKDSTVRREKAIALYNKYIDAAIAAQPVDPPPPVVPTPDAKIPSAETPVVVNPPEHETPQVINNRESALAPNASKAADLTSTYAVEIRRVPGYNGIVTISADKLLVLIIKNPMGIFKFKTEARAKTVIKTIEGVQSLKGLFDINATKKASAIETVKRSNGIK